MDILCLNKSFLTADLRGTDECISNGQHSVMNVMANRVYVAGCLLVMEVREVMEKSWNFILTGKVMEF